MSTDKFSQGWSIEILNSYLAAGRGRGRKQSAATVYDGKVGYFCIHPVVIDSVRQDAVIFACMPHEDIVITEFSGPNIRSTDNTTGLE